MEEKKNNIPVKDWIQQYKEQFERYNAYCETNNWIFASKEDIENEYDAQKTIVKIVLGRLKYFVSKFEPYLDYKYSQEFMDLMLTPVLLYLERCNTYISTNNWLNIDDKEEQIEEVEFQSDIISDSDKVKDELQKLNLDDEVISLDLPIHSDKKIPFLMKDTVENRFPQIKVFKETLADSEDVRVTTHTAYDVADSTEMFINMKNPPPYDPMKHYFEQSTDVIQFYQEELDKIRNGINIAGVYIHGWLYWHINYFKTDIPMVLFEGHPIYDETKERVIHTPFLRDNELFLADAYKEADEKNLGLFIFGTRRAGKTVMESSILTWRTTIVENSESIVIGGDEGDLSKLSKTLEIGFSNVHPAFKLTRNNNDWSTHIQFGLKDKAGERIPYSDIFIKNVNAGKQKSSLKTAGATPTAWIVDEAGKFDCKKMFKQAIPSFQNPKGWGVVPILTGCLTAGNKVFNKQGNLVNIEDLSYGGGIVGFDKNKQEVSFEEITNINPPQSKECYLVETNKGTKVECSFDHPFLVKHRNKTETYEVNGNKKRRRRLEFIEAKDLQEGMVLSLPSYIPLRGNKKMWNPYLIGALIGDGSYSFNRSVRFSNEDLEIWNYINDLGLDYSITRNWTTKKDRDYKEVRFRGLTTKLRELGIFGQVGKNKDLPKDIHLYTREDICELIAGLFDTDGTIYSDGIKNNFISLASSSEKLVDSLKLLLIRLGIHSSKVYIKPDRRDRKIRSKNGYFKLNILDRDSILLFCTFIPLKIERKKVSIENLKKFFKNKNSQLDSNYSNMRFEKISKIEYVGEKPVYNLTTSDTHTYLANGIITHNTGGDAELSRDAQDMLTNPEANKILPMDWEKLERYIPDKELITWKRKSFGIFVPAQMSFKEGLVKIDTNLADFYEIDNEKLRKIELKLTDWEQSLEIIKKERALVSKKPADLNDEKMGYPIDPLECFLNRIENPFPAVEAQLHKEELEREGNSGRLVDVYRKNGTTNMGFNFSEKELAIFPFEGGNIDTPVLMFEDPPEDNTMDGTYVAGLDHYKHDKANTDSLGALYIFKRNVNLDEWSGRIVASYCARPNSIDTFNQIAEIIIEGYGAECLQENADISFQQHLKRKHKDALLLANGEEFAKKFVNPTAKQNNKYGLNPNTKNQQYILNLVISYCHEDIVIGQDEDGLDIVVKGVTRINDIELLNEIIGFDYTGNFDRIISFGHALAWARYLDSLNIMPKVKKNREESTYKKQVRKQRAKYRSPYSGKKFNPYKR